MLDYELLRIIWWGLLGTLLIGLAIMNGLDMGAAGLLPFLGKNDEERRLIINSIGPVWEGNQVWLILGAGAAFAAWPPLYAVSFSGFYFAMFLALFALILRPVGFKFRSKMPHTQWRSFWDWALCLGGAIPALVFGIAFGNLFLGADFYFDDTLRIFYTGSFWSLFHPFALLCGLVSLTMILAQGSVYVALKTEPPLEGRARTTGLVFISITLMVFALGGVYLMSLKGFHVTGAVVKNGPSNPTLKEVQTLSGGWLYNYLTYPWTQSLPLMAGASGLGAAACLFYHRYGLAFFYNSLMIFSIIATGGFSLFPFILPSRLNPNHSLTLWDASSSQLTLFVMLIATALFLPIVLAYTLWVYSVLKGKITKERLEETHLNAY
jgi:cytochrome d ubiquinol oxidase subunit II